MRAAILGLTVGLLGCNQILGVDDVKIGTGDGDAAIDADPTAIDADPNAPDAQPLDAIPNVSTALGARCETNAECPASAPECIVLKGNELFCTSTCGTTPQNDVNPPAGGDAVCTGVYDGSAGTPLCGVYTQLQGETQYTWYCVITCPNGPSDCPNGLTCGEQVCGYMP